MFDERTRKPRGRPRTRAESDGPALQALDRALEVLEVIAARDGAALGEIAEGAALPASTVHRILATLDRRGFVRQEAETGAWTIGVGAYTVGQAFVRVRRIETLSRPAMRALMKASGETVNLGVIEGGEVVFLAQVECPAPIRAYFRPGRRGPAHASGIGKALLAHDGGRRDAPALPRFTDRTLTDREALEADLAATRARGWAMDDEEHTLGMRCLAAPIFDENGMAVAGVSLSGPTVRVTREDAPRLGRLAMDAAAEIMRAIGGRRPEGAA